MVIKNPRVLGGIRLSQVTDETSSPERQRAVVEHWTNAPGIMGRMVGWAEDLDVSGSVSPFKRPELGPWLTERSHEFDVLAVPKVDRLTRKSRHFAEMVDWCDEKRKTLVFVAEGIDMSTSMGRMFGTIIAAFAQGELETIQGRILAAVQTRKSKGVWIAGREPFGYTLHPLAGGGKGLIREEEYAALAREMIGQAFDDCPTARIAMELNRKKVLTWRDRLAVLNGKEPKGIVWTRSAVVSILTNPTLAGYYTHKGELVEDEEGNPVIITGSLLESPDAPYDPHKAIATPREWTHLVRRLTADQDRPRALPAQSKSSGIARCGRCGAGMNATTSGKITKQHYYICHNVQTGLCNRRTLVSRDVVDGAIDSAIVGVLGAYPVYDKNTYADDSVRDLLAQAEARLGVLQGDYVAGKYEGVREESYWTMLDALTSKVSGLRNEVAAMESAPKFIPTGKTYAEVWAEKDSEQKRTFLKRHGVKAYVFRDVVDHADHSIVVQFDNLSQAAKEAAVELPADATSVVNYDVPIGGDGEALTVAELQALTIERDRILFAPQTEQERELAGHRQGLINERLRQRREVARHKRYAVTA